MCVCATQITTDTLYCVYARVKMKKGKIDIQSERGRRKGGRWEGERGMGDTRGHQSENGKET